MFNDIAQATGQNEIDPKFFADLQKCFAKWDDTEELESQEKYWHGMVDYYRNHVRQWKDDWMNCTDPDLFRWNMWRKCTSDYWLEGDGKHYAMIGPKGREWLALEKCNSISSLSYYRSVLRMCEYPDWKMDISYRKALKDGLATLGFSSLFYHASHTNVGSWYDSGLIALIINAPFQAIMEKIKASDRMKSLGNSNPEDARDIVKAVA